MIITKQYLIKLLNETYNEFTEKIMKVDKVEINFVDKYFFLESAKKAFINKAFIEKGIIKDFDKEYPTFLVVYQWDKQPLSMLMTGSYKVSVCFEIAKEKLKPFTAKQVKAYLKHGFAHEITHIVEDKIINERKDLWDEVLKQTKGVEQLAKESLAERIADMICNSKDYKEVEYALWSKIMDNAKRMGFSLK